MSRGENRGVNRGGGSRGGGSRGAGCGGRGVTRTRCVSESGETTRFDRRSLSVACGARRTSFPGVWIGPRLDGDAVGRSSSSLIVAGSGSEERTWIV